MMLLKGAERFDGMEAETFKGKGASGAGRDKALRDGDWRET